MPVSRILSVFALAAGALSTGALGLAALPAHAQPAPALQTIYSSNRIMNAVTASKDGRIFMSFPYWGGGGQGPTVGERLADDSLRPFPDQAWNDWAHSHDALRSFVRVNAIRMGPDGLLWVVDSGEANVGGKPNPPDGAPPKLIAFDLATGKAVHLIVLRQGITPYSYVDDLRFHGDTLILTDAGDPALIVVDMKTGQQRRVLSHKPCTTDERPMRAEGQIMMTGGKEVRIHADQLEISPDGKTLYFQPSSGPMFKVATADLENTSLNDAQLNARVHPFYDTPTTGGTAMDGDGNLYVSDVDHLRIVKITPEGKGSTFIADPRLVWADAMWITDTGALWIPAIQLNRTATFQRDGVSRVKLPVSIYAVNAHLKTPPRN
ncbi:SMP-30/gluconolactonase/LRE family protein [Acetobacter sp. TBRC 12305]|uniref:SMP-30/gluconolactonase/LRE family protein n=1 Tax=Acetobacter garciniae TaxID=2817435 RepID=A0A939HLB7_9PROT|nr:L-dopachrome tautomerase-related protein [Acetobacter garciniae]MBO1326548.1 SMP-30/gluconolactonase/LRE family protein [Acetobacter garciniae]MBX0346270.1 SMP-30/gluconolactonase/LRE family protein [Acetobacter garciniae]